MANLVGTTLATNYLKARETTQMGTRNLAFFQVDMNTNVETNYTDSDSLYARAIRGLQMRVELYGISLPSGNNFTVIASADTAPFLEGEELADEGRNELLETAINDATGGNCAVWNGRFRGWNIENNC